MAASPDGIPLNMKRTLSAPTLSPLPKPRGFDQLISESVQRAVALTVTSPIEVIKTRSQVGLSSWGLGAWGFFRGNFSSFLILYPSWLARSAVGQLFHDALKEENGKRGERLHAQLKLAAQYVGGIAGNIFSNALDVVAARSMAGKLPAQRYKGVFPALMHLGRTEGMGGMSRGLVARCMNTVLSDLILSLCNDLIDIFEAKYLSEDISTSRLYSLSREIVACSIAATAVYPFDTVKRIMQVDTELYLDPSRHWLVEMFVAPFRCLRDVVEHRGVLTLWKGNGWNLVKVFGYVLLVYGTGELTRKYLEQRRNRRRSYLDVFSAIGFTGAAAFALYQFGWLE